MVSTMSVLKKHGFSFYRPVTVDQLFQSFQGQGVHHPSFVAGHRLGRRQGIQDRLFHRFGHGVEQGVHQLVGQRLYGEGSIRVDRQMVAGAEGQEQIAAAIVAMAADSGQPDGRPLGQSFALAG